MLPENIEKKLTKISYSKRRDAFFNKLEKKADNVMAIVPAHPELYRNHDVEYLFRQDSSFKYLTGFEEPDAIAVFVSVKGKREFILFVRPKDLEKEIWTGYRTGVDAAMKNYGADRAYVVSDFESQLPKLFSGVEALFYSFFKTLHRNGADLLDDKILRLLDRHRQNSGRSGRGFLPLYDSQEIIGELRIFKTPEEIERLRYAGQISAFAHTEAMARCRSGMHEGQIEALLEYVFRDNGCSRHGYGSIVASGLNATILHYRENNRVMNDGDFLLIDAGGEFDYYTADITRTFPVNGKWTAEQKEIYQIVLDVQKECIKLAKPGATLPSIHEFAVSALTDAMIKLKFLSGDKKQLVGTFAYKRYYPHGTGHLLGMDVHDAGLYQVDGEPRKLEEGMCFTIEPGFYVLFDDANVPQKYRGLGVRIEDDVIITKNGCEVLTKDVVKETSDISAVVGSKPWLSDLHLGLF